MGFNIGGLLGGLVGYALAPVTGGASLALATGLGAAAGTKLGGGSTEEALTAGLLGGVGGYLGGAGAGAGELVGPMTAGELGAGFEGYMGGLGYTPLEGAAMGPLTAGELGAGFEGYGAGIGGFGAPVVDMSGAGVPGLNNTLGTGEAPFSMGNAMDVARRRLAMLGMGGQGGGLGSLLNIGSGLYGLNLASQMRGMAQDPNAPYRPGYAAELNQLMMNPNQVQSLPGYRAGLQAVQRAQLAQGFQGSGNMMAALAKYGGGAYSDRLAQLERLSGSSLGPTPYLQGTAMANQLASQSLGTLAYGPMFSALMSRRMGG